MEAARPTKRARTSAPTEFASLRDAAMGVGAAAAEVASAESKAAAEEELGSIVVQFRTMEGEDTGPQLEMPLNANVAQMEAVVNQLLNNDLPAPFAFYVDGEEVADTLLEFVRKHGMSTETLLSVKYQPLAMFRVLPVTRCMADMPGHTDAVLHVSFSPDGNLLASGSGDTTVRFWDVHTATPKFTCRGHRHHVLCTAWAPDGEKFASGDFKGEIRVWDPKTGKEVGAPMRKHTKWVTSLSWEPMHSNAACERLVSASKDFTAIVWNVRTSRMEFSLSGHTDSVECVIWGGEGFIYTASRDRSIKVWAADRGVLVRTLQGHAHRVNTMAISTWHPCRSGPFDHTTTRFESREAAHEKACERYRELRSQVQELLVSGSDDFTMFLWDPKESKRPLTRMTGHVQPVNHISFSPDGRHFASASFDKKVKLWDGRTGRFINTLTGHVGAVYMVAWSPDSRLLASASKDQTVKVWDTKLGATKAKHTLPGHADEVYALDWSPNGQKVASGSKDRVVKLWCH